MTELDGTPITSSCRCPKCKGLLVDDLVLAENAYWLSGIRCVNCGLFKLTDKVINYANQTKDRRTNKLDELELYRIRSRGIKCSSYSIQH